MTNKISRPSTLYNPSKLPSEVMESEFLVSLPLQPAAPEEVNLPTDNIVDLLQQCKSAVVELNAKLDAVAEVLRLRDEVFRLQAELNSAKTAKPNISNLEI